MVLVNGINQTDKFQPVGQDLVPGTILAWNLGATQPLSHVSVVYTGEGKSVVIAEKTFYREGTAVAKSSFTWVVKTGFGTNVPKANLPTQLTADAYVINKKVGGIWVADVIFTAPENDAGTIYSWSCPGATIDDATAKIPTIRFSNPGSYQVKLIVTNGYVSSSYKKTFSIRDPGVTAMTWIKHDDWTGGFHPFGFGYYIYPSYKAYNHVGVNNNWQLIVESPDTWFSSFNPKYKLEFKVNRDADSIISNVIPLADDTWYHVTGTFETNTNPNVLKIYVDGSNKGTKTTTGALQYAAEGTTSYDNDHFVNGLMSHDIPFALTPTEITSVYTAEKLSHP